MTYSLKAIEAAADAIGVPTNIDYTGGGTYSLISGDVAVGPAIILGDGDFVGQPYIFKATVLDADGLVGTTVHLGAQSAEEVANIIADLLGLVMACGTCDRRYADNTPAGRCPWEAEHPTEPDVVKTPSSDVIMYGNPVDGIKIVGPFASSEEAINYGDEALSDTEWWLTSIQRPDTTVLDRF